jgi:hypothetical protein
MQENTSRAVVVLVNTVQQVSISLPVALLGLVALAVLLVTMLQIQDPLLVPVAVLVTQQPILASLHALLVLLASTQPPQVLLVVFHVSLESIHLLLELPLPVHV